MKRVAIAWARVSLALHRSAPSRSAPARSTPSRSTPIQRAPARYAPVRCGRRAGSGRHGTPAACSRLAAIGSRVRLSPASKRLSSSIGRGRARDDSGRIRRPGPAARDRARALPCRPPARSPASRSAAIRSCIVGWRTSRTRSLSWSSRSAGSCAFPERPAPRRTPAPGRGGPPPGRGPRPGPAPRRRPGRSSSSRRNTARMSVAERSIAIRSSTRAQSSGTPPRMPSSSASFSRAITEAQRDQWALSRYSIRSSRDQPARR